MTQQQTSRVIQAITETQDMLARAMRYAPDLRDAKLIAFCESHLVKLNAMLGA